MYSTTWLRTILASAAVAVPLAAGAAPAPGAADHRLWALARVPALPEFGYSRQAQTAGDRPDRPIRLDLPAGLLGESVDRLAQLTGLHVTFAQPVLRTLPAPAVTGLLTPAQALHALLDGSGVIFTFTAPDAVTLDLGVTESVAVAGEAVRLTSPKLSAPLRDTPRTIAVISSEVIEQQAASSLRDALRNTPGITLTAGEGGTAPGDNLLIRGFSARNDVYVDGARDPGVASRDTFNTEQVEVTKGPSSSLTGRGATGGSVNIVTKTPMLRDAATATLTGGSAASGRATADVNRTIGEHSAARLNLMWQNQGVARRDDVRNRSWGIAPSLGVGLGTATDWTFGYQHVQQNNVPDYGLPATLPALAAEQGVTIDDLDFSNFYGLLSRDREQMRSDLATATVHHRFGATLSLRNLTRYGRHTLDRVVTPPRAATAAASAGDPGFDPARPQMRRTDTKYQFRTDETLVNQTDLTLRAATGAIGHTLTAGLELARDRQPSRAMTDAFSHGRPPVTDLFQPDDTQPYVAALVPTGASTLGRSATVAGYAFDTMRFGRRWQSDVGLRWDRVAADYDTIASSGARTEFRRTDAAPSGHAAIVFKPSEAASVYAGYSTSFNPAFDGAFGLTLTTTTAPLPPEKTRNIEGGVKWDWGRALVSAAVFRNEKTNAKTVDDTGATVLAGNQRVAGVELGLAGSLTDRWSMLAGLAVMKGTVNASGVAAEVGRQLSYVPRTTFNVWSTYRWPLERLTLGGGAQFTDGYFFNNANTLSSENAAAIQRLTRYWRFDAMASFDVNRHVSLRVNAANLANARYVDRGYNGHFIPGPGRSVLLGPVFRF